MFRKLTTIFAFAFLAIGLLAPAASAYTINADGTGFVGKGEVQTAFGWNNAELQRNAGGVTFSYNSTDSYEAVCTFTTGEGTRGEKTHNVEHNKSTSVSSSVQYQARTANQINGFILTGFGGTTTTGGELPVVGEGCPGNSGHDGVWTSVTLISSIGGLYVNYGGVSVLLTLTPAVI